MLRTKYDEGLSMSDGDDFQVHLKRPPNSYFINHYFAEGLLACEADLDIQRVYKHYIAATYMFTYPSK